MPQVARQELAPFMYLDREHKPRSQYLEYMFEDCFFGRELDDVFRENFRTYCRSFFDIETVPESVFADYRSAVRFVSIFGIVSVRPICSDLLDDTDFAHCAFQSEISLKREYSMPYGIKPRCQITCAPTEHAAVLIAFIELMRDITIAYIENGETTH